VVELLAALVLKPALAVDRVRMSCASGPLGADLIKRSDGRRSTARASFRTSSHFRMVLAWALVSASIDPQPTRMKRSSNPSGTGR
jgi:hypothetical protein